MLPMLAQMAEAEAETPEEHQKVHEMLRRAVDRISVMSYEEDPNKRHPFADETDDAR